MPEFRKNTERHRYEVVEGDQVVGHINYYQGADGVVELPHTEINRAHGGQGLGTALVRHALEDIRAGGQHVKPSCPFVAAYMNRHPATADLRAS